MKNSFFALIFTILISHSGISHSIDLKFEKEIADLARYICSSELKKGFNYDTTILANGDVEFKVFGPKGGDINVTYIYSKKDWGEQQKVLIEDQATRDAEHENCVVNQISILRKAEKKN